MWTWTAKRACWPRMHCASAWPPTWLTPRFPPSAPPSTREAKASEPLFESVGQRIGNVGAARADRSAGGKPGQLGNHAHARRWPVSQKRRDLLGGQFYWVLFFRHGFRAGLESFGRHGE